MNALTTKLRYVEKLAINNSPVLLTAVGVAGTIATALFTHKAALKADDIIRQRENETLLAADTKETVALVWKCYIPPVAAGAMTIGAIVMANRIGTKRAAALAAAYTVSERAYSEYREKVVEKLGETKERNMRDEIVRERIDRNPQSESNVVVIGSGDVLCYEMYTDRYFNSSVEAIKKAVNEVNYQINTHGYASLSDFYHQIGLTDTSVSDEMGWSSDKLMDVDFTTILSSDGRPCVAINYQVEPVRNFHKFH